ncbi:transglycosylase domain-containing protein [Qingshengfaniella alkalisoli]|uniref:transglycosylase domain-containing protein n=1 Tax=Qingshengfaniella alkalisoli TaxID=2599296 RepID=UPI001F0DADBA|nr:PBP1A family penicillin-binding protein [Qingshengfaniella alkalisoli]
MRWFFGLIWSVFWKLGVAFAVVIVGWVAYTATSLPPSSEVVDGRARGSLTFLDRDSQVFAWRGDQFGGVITADTVSPNLKNAIVATEDRRFYSHLGVSPRGIASAIRINLSEGRGALDGHGGSTITQQTAKLLCLGRPYDPGTGMTEAEYEADCRRTTLQRKIYEAIYAMAMEAKYSKDEILTIYMNRAYLGSGTRGFQAASERYFGKSASDVNAAEAAMLAGLLKAPTRYAPTSNLQRSQDRANVIVGLMEEQGYLTTAEAQNARQRPAQLSEAAEERAGGYFADWVMDTVPSFLGAETTEDVIINSTFDPAMQKKAEEALQHIFKTKVSEESKAQAAIVVMSADGAVRAMVGGRKTKVSGAFNRATQALRQTGSAFKPFVYAAALDAGYSPYAMITDEPMTINVPGSGPWSPRNYSRNFAGRVNLETALKNSLNIPAVKVSEAVGRENVRRIARGFGIHNGLDDGPAVALGTSETTLLEMTAAYAGFLNGGSAVTPYGLTQLKLMGDNEPLMGQPGGIGNRIIAQSAAEELNWMLYKVVEEGTGRRAKLSDRPVAGKTGTTQSNRDAWFVGFTGDYVTGVWMGYDDNTPLKGVTGGGLPAEIWHEVMARISEGTPVTQLPMSQPTEPQQYQNQPALQQPQTRQQTPNPVGTAERVLNDVLGNIFGRN